MTCGRQLQAVRRGRRLIRRHRKLGSRIAYYGPLALIFPRVKRGQAMKQYLTRDVNAPWIKCGVCKALASFQIRLEVSGPYGRKGSRALGYFCELHGGEKMRRLRAKS